jgi:predicted enzyme related to lactoylglutathione lyase
MLSLNTIVLCSKDPKKLVEFYKKVFGRDVDWTGGDYSGFKVGASYLVIGYHDRIKGKNQNPAQIMLGFETTDVQGEFERIKKLGALSVAPPYHPGEEPDMWLATLADPDGNYFQLETPMK